METPPATHEQSRQNHRNEQHSEIDDNEIDLSELISGLLEKKFLILFTTLLSIGIASFIAFISTPIYRADALLQIEQESSTIPGLDGLSEMLGTTTISSTEVEVLQSRQILGTAVDQLNLRIQAQPKHFPVVGQALARRYKSDIFPVDKVISPPPKVDWLPTWLDDYLHLADYAWGGEKIRVNTFNIEKQNHTPTWTIVKKADNKYGLYDENNILILNGEVGKTVKKAHTRYGTITLSISDLVARAGTEFTLSKLSRIQAIAKVKSTLSVTEKGKKNDSGIIELSMQHSAPKLAEKILNTIASTYLRLNVERKSQEAEEMLKFIEGKLPELKTQLEQSETALNNYRQKHGTVNLNIETQSAVDTVSDLEKQLSELEIQYTELNRRFAPEHPKLIALNEQTVTIRNKIKHFNKQLQKLPKTEQMFIRLSRDVKVSNELYLSLLNKGQELKIARAGTIGNIHILDSAVAAETPLKPKKQMILALGAILGLMLGIIWAFIIRAMHKGLFDPKDIEQKTGNSIFATIPISQKQEQLGITSRYKWRRNKSNLLAVTHPQELAIEALRSFRTTLQFAQMEAKNNIITISGPAPAIGKSFISTNLAYIMSETEQKILLIDADLRKGTLHRYFKSQRSPGLSELISGTLELEDVLQHTEYNVDFIPSGRIPPNPTTLLMNKQFAEILKTLSENYDAVIIDTAPILAVTDAAIVSQMSGALFLVLESGRHTEREINDAIDRFAQNQSYVNGLILNRAPIVSNKRYRYGQYGRYAYHYHYK